jgi:DNA-directed RNA polymerase
MANDKYVNFATPKGVARYPKIIEPDTKGEYADNKHKTELVLSAEDTKSFRQQALAAAKQLLPGVKNPKIPFKSSPDKKTGEVVESFIFKSTKKPLILDAKKNRINPKNIGAGSVLKIGGSFAAYEKGPNKGITAYLDAVQVIELKEGFDASALFNEEDGYVADEEAAPFSDESGSEDVMEL